MIRTTHYAAIALLIAAAAVHATGPSPGTSDPPVARFIGPDVIADPRSALTCGGVPCRFIGQPGGAGFSDDPQPVEMEFVAVPQVPLPGAAWLLIGAVGALWLLKRNL